MEERLEKTDSIDSIIVGFSKLLSQLGRDSESERCGSSSTTLASSSKCSAAKLRDLHGEITEMQESIEKCRLFKEGQDLYTKWLFSVEQRVLEKRDHGDECDCTGDFKEKLGDLIALSYNNRGYLKYLQVDFEGALKDYTAALKHNPTLPCAYYNRGLVTYRLAFFEQAVQDMKSAVSLDPGKEEFHEGLRKVSEMIGSPNGHKFRLEYDSEDMDNSMKP